MPTQQRRGLRRLRALGRRRHAARAGRGEAHASATRESGASRRSCTPTAWSSEFGQRPVIFYTNGYETWLWDDTRYPPREVQGFYTKDELALLINRRTSTPAARATWTINSVIVERHYQQRAIRRIGEAFERDRQRKALARDGDRRGQDPHGDRAGRPADARRLGQARAVPGRPYGAGQPGGRRVQDAPAGCDDGEPGHRAPRGRARVRLDLPDDDGPDRRGATPARSAASARASSTSS